MKRWRRITFVAASCLLLSAGSLAQLSDSSDSHYRVTKPSRDETSKHFLGREIAQVMGHRGAAWMERRYRVVEEHLNDVVLSAVGKHLAADLTVHADIQIAPPQRIHDQWRLRRETSEARRDYDLLIVAVPAPQARALLTPGAPGLAEQGASVRYSPAWPLMLAFDTDPPLQYDGLFFEGDKISWAVRDGSKPCRSGNTQVLRAAPAWTRKRLDMPKERIAGEMIKISARHTGIGTRGFAARTAHRWRYSLGDDPLDVGTLWDPELGLGLCGDWCQGARIEGAFLSGRAVAGRILGHLAKVNGSRLQSAPLARAVGAE